MTNKRWVDRPFTSKIGWFSRVFVSQSVPDGVPLSIKRLDLKLAESDSTFKHDRTTTVAILETGEHRLVLKRFNPRNHWHKVKRALRRSRAERCWRMSYAFQRAGLNVAQPVLMVERRFGPVRLTAYFANHLLNGKELLTELPTMNIQEQRQVADALEDAFEKMRVAKLTHGDMKATNLIWSDGKLFFIDLDAAVKHRFNATWLKSHQKDRKRFMKNWQGSADLWSLFES